MSYQYNIEIVNATPADAIAGEAGAAKNQITLRCARRDAVFSCTEVPATFEVRGAPSYELLECALVAQDNANTVLAHSTTPLVMGGRHRMVGAAWVPLESVTSPFIDTRCGAAAPLAPLARVFVAWTIANEDGSLLNISELEVPPSTIGSAQDTHVVDSATPRASADTSPLNIANSGVVTPVSVLTSSRRGLAAASATYGDVAHGGGGSGGEAVGMLTAHVSIVLDEAQEAAQHREEAHGMARRISSEPMSMLDSGVGSRWDLKSVEEPEKAQALILSQFPKCSVSSSFIGMPEEVAASGTSAPVDTANAQDAVSKERSSLLPFSPPTWVNLYATSTQCIGNVSADKLHRNLHLVPCPLLHPQLTDEARTTSAAAGPAAAPPQTRNVAGGALWRTAHRHAAAAAPLGSATSAIEQIRLERAAKGSGGAVSAKVSEVRAGVTDEGGLSRSNMGYSTLTLLRQRAMLSMRQRRVSYSD